MFDHESGYLGHKYLLTDSDELLSARGRRGDHLGAAHGSAPIGSSAASSTLVTGHGGLQIDLLWDASVLTSPNVAAIESSVVAAAQIIANGFATHEVINVAVGSGEVGGTKMGRGALGESEGLGYLTNLSTVAPRLAQADASLGVSGTALTSGLSSNTKMYVASAEAKALGLASPTSTVLDGYIGLSTSGLAYGPTSTVAAGLYDAVGVAAHELTEVMGRVGMEGTRNEYTALDLFRYTAPGTHDLTPTSGYFSLDNGATNLGAYNNPKNGGDAADWASSMPPNDAFNAFGSPGLVDQVSTSDFKEVSALGYQLLTAAVSPVTA